MDTAQTLRLSYQLTQATIAAGSDIAVYGLAAEAALPARDRRAIAAWTLVCQLASWFNAYVLVRTYSNSVEATLCALGVLAWVRARAERRAAPQVTWLALAAACFALRPHSGVFWVLPGLLRLHGLESGLQRCRFAGLVAGMGAATLAVVAVVDRIGYGR